MQHFQSQSEYDEYVQNKAEEHADAIRGGTAYDLATSLTARTHRPENSRLCPFSVIAFANGSLPVPEDEAEDQIHKSILLLEQDLKAAVEEQNDEWEYELFNRGGGVVLENVGPCPNCGETPNIVNAALDMGTQFVGMSETWAEENGHDGPVLRIDDGPWPNELLYARCVECDETLVDNTTMPDHIAGMIHDVVGQELEMNLDDPCIEDDEQYVDALREVLDYVKQNAGEDRFPEDSKNYFDQ